MTERRELLLRVCAALWGFAIGISLLPFWTRPAPPGQPPGYMTLLGLDYHTSFRFTLGLILAPILVAMAMRPATALLARDDTRPWARNSFCAATLFALWYVVIERSPIAVISVPLAVLIVAIALRHFRARFTRHDMILLPALAAANMALLDLTPKPVNQVLLAAAAMVFGIRLALAALPRRMPPAYAFAAAPLALVLQSHFFAYHERHAPWPPLLIVALTPFILRALVPDSPRARRVLRRAIALGVYPVAAYAYISATSQFATEGMPHANLFEDSHNLFAASEMLRGEKPYRDAIPSHGLIHDGLLPYLSLRTGPATLGRVLKVRGVIGGLNLVAQYAVAAAATGSPDAGLAAVFLGMMLGTAGGFTRVLPALATLAVIVAAVRRRKPRLLAVGGVLVVLSIFTSLDFGAYTLIIILIAALRFRGERVRALTYAAIGGGAAALIAFIALALNGIAGDFVSVTLSEIASLAPAYTLNPFTMPPALNPIHHIPEVIVGLFEKSTYLYVVWPLVVIGLAVALTRTARTPSARRRARQEALIVVAAFAVVTGISYAERHHLYWLFVTAPLAATVIFGLFRSRIPLARALAPAAVLLALVIAQPTAHIAISASLRRSRGPLDPSWRELGLPRARGALVNPRDAAVIDVVYRYALPRLADGETFFDFTNRGLLYFLLDRDCPIRQPEVAFYETEPLQREVISRIERNPHIRFALVPPPVADDTAVDGIPNAVRAPLVWQYLQQHFTPDHEEGGVVFWYRK